MQAELLLPAAHAKWVVLAPETFTPDVGRLGSVRTLGFVGSALVVAVLWRTALRRLPQTELSSLRLQRLVPWVPRIAGAALGTSLLALAVDQRLLAPHVVLDGTAGGSMVALAEGLVGVWLISGVRLRRAAVALLAFVGLAAARLGLVGLLEGAHLLGLAAFLALLPASGERCLRPTARQLLALRIGVGLGLVVPAFSEKLVNPGLMLAVVQSHPIMNLPAWGLPVDEGTFVALLGAAELLLGLLVLSAAGTQVVGIAALVPLVATLPVFGRAELFGHLPIYAALGALVIYSCVPDLAPVLERLPRRRPPQLAAPPRRQEPVVSA